MKPKIFVASSVEGLSVAYAIQTNLQHTAELTVWDQGVFALSHSALESLIAVLSKSDFGVFIFTGDDITKIRGKESITVRDNVVFELGMFIGRLGKERSFIIIPAGADLRLPTDLIGLTPGTFETGRSDDSYEAACGPACNRIRESVKRLGFLVKGVEGQEAVSETESGGSKAVSLTPAGPDLSKDLSASTWADAWVRKDFSKAIELLSAETEEEPDYEKKYSNLCVIGMLEFERDSPKGLRYFEEMTSKEDARPLAYWWMASSLAWSELHSKALSIVEAGLSRFENDETLLSVKASCLERLGKSNESIEVLRSALIAKPSSASLYEVLAQQYIDKKDFTNAREALVRGLTFQPKSEPLWSKFAYYLANAGDYLNAARAFRKLIMINEKHVGYMGMLGNAYLSLGFHGMALESYRKANQLAEGKQGWILANIANLLSTLGLSEEAIVQFREALKIEPDSQFTHERLAIAMTNRKAEVDRCEDILASAPPLLAIPPPLAAIIPGIAMFGE